MKSWLKRLVSTLAVLGLLFGLVPATPALADGESWLNGYQFRQGVNISRAAGAVVDYQMKLTVYKGVGATLADEIYLDDKALSWLGTVPNDLRFTSGDGGTELDYWIEESDDTTATVWIEFDDIGAGATRFYVYYCKSDDTTTSDGAATFIAFDGFEDLIGWVGDTGDFSSDGDIVTGTGPGAAWKAIDNAWAITAEDKRFRYRTLYDAAAGTSISLRLENGALNRYMMDRQNIAAASDLIFWDGGGPTTEGFPENARGAWHTIEWDWTAGNCDYYADDVEGANSPIVGNVPNDLTYYLSLGAFTNTIKIDWCFIGLFHVVEPAWGAWEAEEEGAGDFLHSTSFLVEGSADGILTDYPMRLVVHYGAGTNYEDNVYLDNNSQTDFDDILFTNAADGQLDYWIESYIAGVAAIVWVEFDSIAADPAETMFYIVYGNDAATSASNGENTFDFFTDFDDLDGWGGDLGDYGVAAGILTATETGGGGGWAFISTADAFAADQVISYRWKLDSDTSHGQTALWGATDFVATKWHATSEPHQGYLFTREGADLDYDTSPEIVVNTWQVHRIDWYAASVHFRIDNAEVASSPLTAEVPNDADLVPYLGVYELDGWTMDWYFVGQQVANTPLWGDWEGAAGTPTVTTVAASGVTYDEAQLNATLDAVGDSGVVIRGFDWGGGYTPFTVAVIPDTQGYVLDYPEIFTQQVQWILDNKEELNIKFVIHLGDLINMIRLWGADEEIEAEWVNADTSMSLLDGEIPYILAIGNHDYENCNSGVPIFPTDADARELTFFDDHFPVSRFSGYDWFGGGYSDGTMRNSYSYFEVDDQEFMVMSLEFLFDDTVMAWAADILDANTDKHVIIVTHQYVSDQSAIDGLLGGDYYNFPSYNNPEDMWDDLFSDYSNISLIVGGHFVNDGVGRVIYYIDGQPINQCLSNYQGPTIEPMGGNGWLRYYEFDMGNNEIEAVTYSPYLSQYKSDDAQRFTLQFRRDGDGFGALSNSVTTAGDYDTGAFNRFLEGLNPGCEHNFRAKAYNTQGWGYGDVLTFTTADTDFPSVTTEAATNVGTVTATLQGALAGLGEFTPVYVYFEYGQTVAYGTTTAEETMTAAGGFYKSISGLNLGVTYQYRAVVRYEEGTISGSNGSFTTLTAGAPGIDAPDILRIDDVKVFSGYFEDDDQLYVIAYRIMYTAGTPTLDVGDYFDFQLLDGDVLRGQWPVKMWGYRPGSLYLKAASAPDWGGDYRVKIVGTPGKWDTPPECYRDLTPGDWQGDDLTQLDSWVISLGDSFQSYYDLEYVVRGGDTTYLSEEGGARFVMGISGLNIVRPGLFSPIWDGYVAPTPNEGEAIVIDIEETIGSPLYELTEEYADFINVDTDTMGALAFSLGYILLAVAVGLLTKNAAAGLGLSTPVLIGGAVTGFIPMAVIALGAGIFVMYGVHAIWLKGT